MLAQMFVLLLSLAGFLLLCLAQAGHQQPMLRRKLRAEQTRLLRLTGWIVLSSAWALAWWVLGFGRGTMLFGGCATVGAACTVGLLNRRSAR